MSFNEIALFAGGVAAGAAAGSIGIYLYARKPLRAKNVSSEAGRRINFEDVDDAAIQRLVSKPELEKTRRELRKLLLEKDLVSAALTRLYEAEASHEITREERETLSLKYREELKSLNEKILKIDSFIEVGDLETLREQLIDLVRQKIEAIEKRIEKARVSSAPLLVGLTPAAPVGIDSNKEEPKTSVPSISNLLEAKPEAQVSRADAPNTKTPDEQREIEKPLPKKKSPDAQADELQKELLEALDRLEKLDIEN